MATETSAGTKDPGPAGELTDTEKDRVRAADPAVAKEPKAPGPDTSGKRVRYIPYKGGTHAEVSKAEFKRVFGIDHPTVNFNFRNNVFTAPVGDGKNGTITQEAAEGLCKEFPTMFEFMGASK